MANPAKTEAIINISQFDSSSDSDLASSPPSETQSAAPVCPSPSSGSRGEDISMPGIRANSSSRKKTFQTYPGPGQSLKQQRAREKEGSGRCLLSDPEMEGGLQFCLRQLNCFEDTAGFTLRREVIRELEQLVKLWVREEAARLGAAERAQARLVCFGSFKLSVIDCQSDLDLLCVVPSHVTRSSFFTALYHRLQNKTEVSQLRQLPAAYVPVIKMFYRGVEVDLTMARVVTANTIPVEETFLMTEDVTRHMEPECLRSLNGYRATCEILTLVPNPDTFKKVLRVVKIWAKKHGIYSQILGFLGGASWAILVAKACQLVGTEGRQDSLLYTIHRFFVIFGGWAWPDPVYIKVMGQCQTWHHCMPIITSSQPQMNSAVNISPANCWLIQTKCQEASVCLQQIRSCSAGWRDFFSPTNFFKEFSRYLVIAASCSSRRDSSLWFGSVESKLRPLVNHIGFSYGVNAVRIWPRPFKKSQGSVVKQWFLGLDMNGPVSVEIIQEPVLIFLERCQEDAAKMFQVSPQASSFKVDFEFLTQKQVSKVLPKNIINGFSGLGGYRSLFSHGGHLPGFRTIQPPPIENNNNHYQGKTAERKFPEFNKPSGALVWPGISSLGGLKTRQI